MCSQIAISRNVENLSSKTFASLESNTKLRVKTNSMAKTKSSVQEGNHMVGTLMSGKIRTVKQLKQLI